MATEVNVYRFMCSRSQQIREQMSLRRKKVLIMAFCGATVGSLRDWLHRNRFHPDFQDVKGYFYLHLSAPLFKTLTARHSVQATCLLIGWQQGIDLKWCKSRMNSDMTVQTEVALWKIRPVSDLWYDIWKWPKSELKRSDSMWFVPLLPAVWM